MQPLTISLVQTRLHWEDKAANLAMLEEKIMGIREKTELVVLPEMFSTGFSMRPEALAEPMDGDSVQWMKKLAAQKKSILTGSLIIEEGGHYYNRLIWMLPNGQYGVYDKRHRFAFAGEDRHYSAGSKRLIASVRGWKVCLQVCYDLRFPVFSRNRFDAARPGLPDYDLALYVANWPSVRSYPWKTLLRARAIENLSFVVGVNRVGSDGNGLHYSGDSAVIDFLGHPISECMDEEVVTTTTLQDAELLAHRARFPALRDADTFTLEG